MGMRLQAEASRRLQTARTCSSVACDCMTTSMEGSLGAVRVNHESTASPMGRANGRDHDLAVC